MTRHRSFLRKLVLDLTPLIDMITILMFGVMIHAFEKSRVAEGESEAAKEDSAANRQALSEVSDRAKYLAETQEQLAGRIKDLQDKLGKTEQELKALQAKIDQERQALAEALARLLDNVDPAKLKQILAEQDLSRSGAERLLKALKAAEDDPASAYKALRRIEEMEKAFTFIDFHLDGEDFLHLAVNGRKVDRIAMRGRSVTEVTNTLRDKLQPGDFSQVILFMYSTDPRARSFTAETVDDGIRELRVHFDQRFAGQGKQFRYAALGLIDHVPPTLDKGK